ncbi:PulJ/GspJ family protein [Blastochloris sulfoviridis]|uniref:Prepilin-type N-terminal cleavage/methylation domain-containing protein n=1 Tax=Blastochloris sulfoviridis TaxID=50712 RepID=A0A5M6I727_9HYPH|nr:prepilin-type N-terminal cleavage/methylation domain-containing protein [Blastochloris sulfoviridis]KAA5603687.1 prepilin-type N-terminal cleavage/methylation domain-containing protein [Blastochloris sulfoviridis]
MTRPRNASEAGFTLFEALVAMALMGLIMGALAAITAEWLPNWNRGMARIQRNEQVAVALDRLAADLAAAQHVAPNRQHVQPLFVGGELSVIFVRTAIGPNTRPGLEFVRIAETADKLGRALVRTRAPFVPLPAGTNSLDRIPFADPVVLLRAPFRVVFAYAGPEGGWRNVWHEKMGSLPLAVRFTVRDAGTERVLDVSTATLVHVQAGAPEPEPPEEPAVPPGTQPQGGAPAGRRGR